MVPYKTLRDTHPPGTLVLAHCRAHRRRKLREVFDRAASPIANEAPRHIAEFYQIEATISERRRISASDLQYFNHAVS